MKRGGIPIGIGNRDSGIDNQTTAAHEGYGRCGEWRGYAYRIGGGCVDVLNEFGAVDAIEPIVDVDRLPACIRLSRSNGCVRCSRRVVGVHICTRRLLQIKE